MSEKGRTKEGREEENMCSTKFDGPIRTNFKVIFLQFYKELTVDHLKNKSCVRLIGQAVSWILQSKIK